MDLQEAVKSVHLTRSVNGSIEIHAPLEKVFNAVTTAAGMQRWFADEAEVDHEGDKGIMLAWNEDSGRTVIRGKFSRLRQPKLVELTWTEHNGKPLGTDGANKFGSRGPVKTIFEMKVLPGGSVQLLLRDSGVSVDPRFDTAFRGKCTGWQTVLPALKIYCETGEEQRAAIRNLVNG